MNKKRFLATMMTLSLATGIMAGCGGQDTSKTDATTASQEASKSEGDATTAVSSGEQTTIVACTWTDEINEMTKIKEDFEALNPNVKVNILEFPSGEYKDKLVIQLAGGADIDVINHKNTAEYADVASKNQLLDLESLVQKDNLDIVPYGPLYDGLKFDGKQYGIPYRKTAWVLFYNKDLFDAAGMAYPTDDMTWDQFRETAKQITSGTGNDKTWGAYFHTWPQTWYGQGLQTGASIIDEDLTPFKEALQFKMDLEADGSVMTYMDAKATNAHYKTEFAKGKTAMNIIGDFHIQQLRDFEESGEITFDWDIAAMPHPEGVEPNTTWGTANPISINVKSKKQDAAWEFVKYVAGSEGAKEFARHGDLPAYSNEEIQKIYAGEEGQKPVNVDILGTAKVYFENPTIPGAAVVKDEIYGREAELTFAGERSVEDTFKVIQERIKEELK